MFGFPLCPWKKYSSSPRSNLKTHRDQHCRKWRQRCPTWNPRTDGRSGLSSGPLVLLRSRQRSRAGQSSRSIVPGLVFLCHRFASTTVLGVLWRWVLREDGEKLGKLLNKWNMGNREKKLNKVKQCEQVQPADESLGLMLPHQGH